jgi:hypothetical protein
MDYDVLVFLLFLVYSKGSNSFSDHIICSMLTRGVEPDRSDQSFSSPVRCKKILPAIPNEPLKDIIMVIEF